jgi:hypothetical protein
MWLRGWLEKCEEAEKNNRKERIERKEREYFYVIFVISVVNPMAGIKPNFYRQLMLGLYTWWIVEPLLPPTAVPPPGR